MANLTVSRFVGGLNNVIDSHLLDETFATELINADVNEGSIKSVHGDVLTTGELVGELTFQNDERSLVKWGGAYYWSDNATQELGSSLGYLGISAPSGKPLEYSVGGGGGGFDGVYKYLYTFRTAEGFESAPFETFPDEVTSVNTLGPVGSITLSGFDAFIPDEAMEYVIYRTLADGGNYYQAGSIYRNKSTFVDKMQDDSLILRKKLDLSALPTKIESGKFLTERNAVFYLAVGDRLHLSQVANPHGWNPLHFVSFDDDITGIQSLDAMLLVTTLNRAYVITGDNINDIYKRELPDAQGVRNWKTIAKLRNAPIWLSNDGLCMYSNNPNREGRYVQVISENLVDIPDKDDVQCAAVFEDKYYLFWKDKALVFDFRGGLKVSYETRGYEWAWHDKDNDRLLGRNGSAYYEVGNDKELLPFTYTSPAFSMGELHKSKRFGRFYLDANCDCTISVIADDKEVFTTESKFSQGRDERSFFLPNRIIGKKIQFKIEGSGEVRSYQIEYILGNY